MTAEKHFVTDIGTQSFHEGFLFQVYSIHAQVVTFFSKLLRTKVNDLYTFVELRDSLQ